METLKSITAKKKGLKMTNKLKPFDLQAALKGEPVMLRDGSKAFVRHHETEQSVDDDYRLWGVLEGGAHIVAWAKDGCYDIDGDVNDLDIIGMYTRTHTVNGFEVPAPVREELKVGDAYFSPDFLSDDLCEEYEWEMDRYDFRLLKRGLVFLNKEDTIANAKAMLGINPYTE